MATAAGAMAGVALCSCFTPKKVLLRTLKKVLPRYSGLPEGSIQAFLVTNSETFRNFPVFVRFLFGGPPMGGLYRKFRFGTIPISESLGSAWVVFSRFSLEGRGGAFSLGAVWVVFSRCSLPDCVWVVFSRFRLAGRFL